MAKKAEASKSINGLLLPGKDPSELVLTYAGNIVKHLGVQMYSGRPVPAIAELISNSWDADAKTVQVRIPLDETWESASSEQFIEVSDDGHGMSWEMIKDGYLDVGRDRRESERTDKSPGGRPLQGRKGVGKLAGFGIADTLEVMTVHEKIYPDSKSKVLIWFRLTMERLRNQKGRVPVELIFAGPINKAPAGGRKNPGTTVILRDLHARKAQSSERFLFSMTRRFLLLGPQFRVIINDKELKDEKYALELREPDSGWADDDVPGCGPVKYWIGFTPKPRKQNDGDLSGILVYTRNKVSQEATFFDVSGGVTGQHGLRYMVGKVRAEWLDKDAHSPDLIATPRDAIAWESPQGEAFMLWGQKKVKESLSRWAKHRAALRERQVREVNPNIWGRIQQLAPAYKDTAIQFYEKIKPYEMEPEEFEVILSLLIEALENQTLRSILTKLRNTDITDLDELDRLLAKMEVRTAVTLLQIIDSNLAAIDTLEQMHLQNAKERGVISVHIEQNPWLIEPTWIMHESEARVATWIRKHFKLKEKGAKGDSDRVDLFCIGVAGTLHIVEIKRGAHIAKTEDLNQAEKYRLYVEKRFHELTDPNAIGILEK